MELLDLILQLVMAKTGLSRGNLDEKPHCLA
jgi:hypothetical protein